MIIKNGEARKLFKLAWRCPPGVDKGNKQHIALGT